MGIKICIEATWTDVIGKGALLAIQKSHGVALRLQHACCVGTNNGIH